ncbi:hypothetical protein KBI51_09595 [Aerococcaceae bacterium zg-ZUI334]|uniref:hypothetical protein n=1 Tax=Aerococcaceae bacterium zg-252 TaxID=2796928 RepID=UPI001B9C5A65|nr:hypothetical protein [Aerococcaceae bacterium zg-ZUI334]
MDKLVSLTLRIPKSLNQELKYLSSQLGFTKSSLIKIAIHEFVDKIEMTTHEFTDNDSFRMVLKVNDITHRMLIEASKRYELSINQVVIKTCYLSVERYTKLLRELNSEC